MARSRERRGRSTGPRIRAGDLPTRQSAWRRRRIRTASGWGLMAVGAALGVVHFLEMIGVGAVLPMSLHFAYYPLAGLFIILGAMLLPPT
jgi:hypothetical protein